MKKDKNKVEIHTIKDKITGALRDVRVEYTKDGIKVGPYYGPIKPPVFKDKKESSNPKDDNS